MVKTKTVRRVADIAKREDLQFVSDSQDTEAIKDHLGNKAKDYDSFFVRVENGDYAEVYGMIGIVPLLTRALVKLV